VEEHHDGNPHRFVAVWLTQTQEMINFALIFSLQHDQYDDFRSLLSEYDII
jgi:hypothetical protein